MKIFTSQEISDIESRVLSQGVTLDDIIEATGPKLAKEISTEWRNKGRMYIFAGNDRCGAFTLAAARHLDIESGRISIVAFNIGGNKYTTECQAARDRFIEAHGSDHLCEVVGLEFDFPEISRHDIIIDGIYGTERKLPLTGGYKYTVQRINEAGARVVSIDIPSGLTEDTSRGIVNRDIVNATVTLTPGLPRLSFLFSESASLIGAWRTIAIKEFTEAVARIPSKYRIVEQQDIRSLLPQREAFASKADYGSAIIYAGSLGMMGAAVLAVKGALRAGAGKVTCHAPSHGYNILQTAVPCALCDPDCGKISISQIELKRKYDAVAIGPGIGTAEDTINALDCFLKVANANSNPVVLDADALNCIAIRTKMLDHIPVMSVLTPHVGEFDLLFGKQPSSATRLQCAIDVAERYQVIIVLKGHYTAIVRPDGKVYFNPTGSPAMATAGSGDVLTGIMAGMIAQGLKPELAAIAATYIHGLAGEIAAQRHGTYGTLASDIADAVGQAIKTIIE